MGSFVASHWKTILMMVIAVVLILLAGVYYGLGYYIYNTLTVIEPRCERIWMEGKRDNTPERFFARYLNEDPLIEMTDYAMASHEDVSFSPRDEDLRLNGWFIPAPEESEYVVIIVPGIHSCRRDPTVLLPASMLHRNGFNVLIVELRNHGDSEIEDGHTSVGNREYRDVLGAFDYLLERGFEAEDTGVLGISFGGGTATIAFGQEPEIAALFLDSPFGNLKEIVENELQLNGIPTFLSTAAFQMARLNGVPLNILSPDEEIAKHNDRPVRIIHGTADERVPIRFGEQLYELAGPNASFIPVEGMEHVETQYVNPDLYEEALVTFFNDALNDD